jgi:Zn-dependent M16 (insulinase) family peptidase
MKLELKKVYHGFRFVREKPIRELKAKGRIFLHEKSGARLLSLENDDDNKVFSVSFRTPPSDNTGIPHIIEHSALCGSRKFPTKEPFIELAKGSMNTFLNAMTFPDKTMYPVASRNKKDFYNLVDVYLDAVFYPNLARYPEIFMQEGWHYELDSPDNSITYKGVVYNEMKGVFSNPEAVLFKNVLESLFPDTTYGYESGGDPDVIPDLTLEQFVLFHRRYYHPSNCYIFFYGDGDVAEYLEFLDANYLNDFGKTEIKSKIGLQSQFTEKREVVATYPILPHEEEKDKTYFSLNWVIDRATNPELVLAFTILEYLLLETPAAPLKVALQNAQIGKDVFGQFEGAIMQPLLSVVLKNSNKNHREKFGSIVFETLNNLVSKGIDKKQIEAAINIHEFKLREADFRGFPKGLVYCMSVMGSWLYDGDPFMHLEYETNLKKVKRALKNDYFERLIKQYLIQNPHQSLVVIEPEKGLAERLAQEAQEKLDRYKEGLDVKQVKEIIGKTSLLKKRQMTPDKPEDLEKIPLLSLSDIERESEKLPLEEMGEEGVKILSHPIFTNGIAYVDLLFDTSSVPQKDLPYVSLLTQILAKVSTGKYFYADLSNHILIHTGGVRFSTETFSDKDDDSLYYPKLMVRSKSLVSKLPELCNVLGEIMGNTRFDETKRFREIIQETKSRFEMSLYDRGHFIAAGRLLSYFSPSAQYSEMLGGISFFQFVSGLEKEFDKKADEIMQKLRELAQSIFSRKNLMVSVTSAMDDLKNFRGNFPRILGYLSDWEVPIVTYSFNHNSKNEGLLTPGKVQYVAKGYNFKKLGFEYSGSLQVLRTIASLDYLWNRIRVQGGAYGSFARFSRDGNMYFCSYRDPNLAETLEVYDKADEYFRTFNISDREITKYVIGTISKLDHPLTPSMKGEVATERYLQNIAHEDVQQLRDEILSTVSTDIRKSADLIMQSMKKDYICVLGNEGKIKENSALFDNLVNVF